MITTRTRSSISLLSGLLLLLSAVGWAQNDAAVKEDAAKKPGKPMTAKELVPLVKKAIDRGCNFLIDNQRPEGAFGEYAPDVGITALALHALGSSPRQYREGDGPFISAAVAYIMKNRKENGAFYDEGQGLWNYKTSMTMLALTTLDRGRTEPRYAKEIAGAREFIAKLQCSEVSKPAYSSKEHPKAYGGIGYGSDRRPDLSNTQFALEALHAAGLAEDSEVYKRALRFLQRCQNHKTNDHFEGTAQTSTKDGGFFYLPGDSKAGVQEVTGGGKGPRSYGSMTYAGIKSYIYSGLKPDDERVKAALEWAKSNFTVDENPGMATEKDPARGQQGLFYYYLMMARTFDVLQLDQFQSLNGVRVKWAEELSQKLLSLQAVNGSWINPADRWLEGERNVVTSYTVLALTYCYHSLKRSLRP